MVTWDSPVDRQTDKHYLPTTSLAGGNNSHKLSLEKIIVIGELHKGIALGNWFINKLNTQQQNTHLESMSVVLKVNKYMKRLLRLWVETFHV